MFSFFKKKKIDQTTVNSFDSALEFISICIKLSEWEKGKKSIHEIKEKEKLALDTLIEKLGKEDSSSLPEREKHENIYNKNVLKLEKIEQNLLETETKYREKELKQRFKIRFQKIQNEIKAMTAKGNNIESLNFLQIFLEENKTRPDVIKFYNKQKKEIQVSIQKQNKKEEEKMKSNAKMEALKLIGQKVQAKRDQKNNPEANLSFFGKMKTKFDLYGKIKEAIKKKKLEQEIMLLIEEDTKVEKEVAAKKLENIHKGLIKEINNDSIEGYELYGKILGADKISGDTFGFNDFKDKYNFFLGDATGHGIRAGFIVTLLSRLFNQHAKQNNLGKLTYEINNGLKQDLQSRNFITGIFFEIKKEAIGTLHYVGMGHEPMLVYRSKEKKIEKIIPGGLAAGIRLIKEESDVKVKELLLDDGDIVLTYSDGMIETKNIEGEFYGLEKLMSCFEYITQRETNLIKIYDYLLKQLQLFKGGSQFLDDTSVLIFKRNTQKDKLDKDSEYLKQVSEKEGLKKREIKKLEGKSVLEIERELLNMKKEKEIGRIVKVLENLYVTGEILQLKQESIRYIKDGYISSKINTYLKRAIANENKYKIEQKEQKVKNKFNVLDGLLKSGDYASVITEVEDIIAQDGNL